MWCLSVNRCEVPEVLGLSLQRNAPLWPLITGCCYCCCFQHPDRTIPVIIIGLLVFLPGFYHLRIAYYAAKGYRGYSYDDIPDFGDWARRQLLMPRCSIRDCCLTFTLIFWMYVASKAELVFAAQHFKGFAYRFYNFGLFTHGCVVSSSTQKLDKVFIYPATATKHL